MKFWKRFAAAVLSLSLAAGLCACGSKEPDTVTLGAAFVSQAESFDPAFAVTQGEKTAVLHMYENLMKPGGAGVIPGMAKSYVCTDNLDGTETYTFTLRSDAKWSDGKPVTAAHFVYAWQRLVDPATESPNASLLEMVKGYETAIAGAPETLAVSAPEETKLVVELNCHCPDFVENICTATATMPLRPDLAENGSWGISNGAYQKSKWKDGVLSLTASKTYYNAKRVTADGLELYFTDTVEQALELYEAGTVDLTLPAGDAEDAVSVPLPTVGVLLLNQMAGSMSREPLRQALSLAIDRNAVAETLGEGYTAAEGLIPYGITTTQGESFREANGALLDNDPEHYEANCQQARELMAEAGYTNESAIDQMGTVTLIYMAEPRFAHVAQQLKTVWQEQLGVTVVLESVPAEEMAGKLSAAEFTMALVELSLDRDDPVDLLERFQSGSGENYGQYHSSAYDMLMRVAAASGSAEARDAYLQDAERLLQEGGYVSALYGMEQTYLLREGLVGLCSAETGIYYLGGVVESAD